MNERPRNTSRLLINENPLMVLPSLAARIGLNEAIFVQQVHYWLQASRCEKLGRKWIYNTIPQWQEQFPFWSERTIKSIIQSLKSTGLLLVEQLGQAFDKTNYYSINYDVFDLIEGAEVAPSEGAEVAPSGGQDFPHLMGQKLPHHLTENTKTTETETTTENPPKSPTGGDAPSAPVIVATNKALAVVADGDLAIFEQAWKAYPKRAGGNSKASAFKAWNARLKQGESLEAMLAGVKAYARFCDATGKTGTEFVKQAATFFGTGKHYLDAYELPKSASAGKRSVEDLTRAAGKIVFGDDYEPAR